MKFPIPLPLFYSCGILLGLYFVIFSNRIANRYAKKRTKYYARKSEGIILTDDMIYNKKSYYYLEYRDYYNMCKYMTIIVGVLSIVYCVLWFIIDS